MSPRFAQVADAVMSPGTFFNCLAHRILRPGTLRHTLQITSAGGTGTTFLYEYAQAAGLNVFQPFDGGPWHFDYGIWKHLRFPIGHPRGPRIRVRPGYRVVYLISHPFNMVCSLFRRGITAYAPERLQVDPSAAQEFNRTWTVDEYLAHGVDIFQLEDHVRNWTRASLSKSYPIMVLKYERLPQHRDELLEFMRVPTDRRSLFPELRPRTTDFASLSATSLSNMKSIYGRLADYVHTLPDCYVR